MENKQRIYPYDKHHFRISKPVSYGENEHPRHYINFTPVGDRPAHIPFNETNDCPTLDECKQFIDKLMFAQTDEAVRKDIQADFDALQNEIKDMLIRYKNPMLKNIDEILLRCVNDYNENISVGHKKDEFRNLLRIYDMELICDIYTHADVMVKIWLADDSSYDKSKYTEPPICLVIAHCDELFQLEKSEVDFNKNIFDTLCK